MTEVTNEQLIELRDSDNLTSGEVYLITNYGSGTFKIYMTADSVNTFLDESTTEDPNIILHYDLDQAKIDYMKDTVNRIEGYFDWTDNIEGTVSDIYFENAALLHVKDSSNVVCENEVGAASDVTNCTNITIGDGAILDIESCSDITVGGGTTLTSASSSNITVGERNNLSITNRSAISIGDDNENCTFLADTNIIGGKNKALTVDGTSNVVSYKNINVEISGDVNKVEETSHTEIGGSFNTLKKTTLSELTNSVGNTLEASAKIDVINTNNNVVMTDSVRIYNKPAFVQYQTVGAVRKVKNLVEPINMQADCNARTLVMDEQRFYQEGGPSGTKGSTKYEIVDGQWTAVQI